VRVSVKVMVMFRVWVGVRVMVRVRVREDLYKSAQIYIAGRPSPSRHSLSTFCGVHGKVKPGRSSGCSGCLAVSVRALPLAHGASPLPCVSLSPKLSFHGCALDLPQAWFAIQIMLRISTKVHKYNALDPPQAWFAIQIMLRISTKVHKYNALDPPQAWFAIQIMLRISTKTPLLQEEELRTVVHCLPWLPTQMCRNTGCWVGAGSWGSMPGLSVGV
jgi:hypothetical protein